MAALKSSLQNQIIVILSSGLAANILTKTSVYVGVVARLSGN